MDRHNRTAASAPSSAAADTCSIRPAAAPHSTDISTIPVHSTAMSTASTPFLLTIRRSSLRYPNHFCMIISIFFNIHDFFIDILQIH